MFQEEVDPIFKLRPKVLNHLAFIKKKNKTHRTKRICLGSLIYPKTQCAESKRIYQSLFGNQCLHSRAIYYLCSSYRFWWRSGCFLCHYRLLKT